jgi:hypothetical protein
VHESEGATVDDGYPAGIDTDLCTRPLGKVALAAARSARTGSRQHLERFFTCQVPMNGIVGAG